MEGPQRYVHGTSPAEQERLTKLNELLNEACVAELALRGDERVVDFGSGLGQLTRAIARSLTSGGTVVGIEASGAQLAEARRQAQARGEGELVDFRAGSVEDPPLAPDEWERFDVAHARFVLEHVRDPLTVVRRMVRAVRPGGRIVLADDDHEMLRLWPEAPAVMRAWSAYASTYANDGKDPLVGRRLVSLLHASGARPRRNTLLFFGGCAGHASLPAVVENLARILDGARPAILETGRLGARELDAALAQLRDWGTRPDAAFWFALPWAEGVKPGPETAPG